MHGTMNVKRTKIVATLGPATNSEEMIRVLAEHGVDVFRINFSHGTDEERLATIAAVKKVRGELDLPLAILQDLQGPKIRLGMFSQGPCEIMTGGVFRLTTQVVDGNAEQASVDYPRLTTEVHPGELIFINDGLIRLKTREIEGDTIVTEVLKGGTLSDHKGVNFPQSDLHVPSITDKDRHDLLTGLRAGVDYVALSFVRTADDVRELRMLMETHGAHVPIIVKVEKWQAVQNIESILAMANGIMVARGDLGVEMPVEEVPIIQKRLIALCNRMGKPVITATQMLNSMVENPSPTRAEVTDVANAIFDGTDAVMLSNETAIGRFPVETVEMMERVIQATERSKIYWTAMEAATDRVCVGHVGCNRLCRCPHGSDCRCQTHRLRDGVRQDLDPDLALPPSHSHPCPHAERPRPAPPCAVLRHHSDGRPAVRECRSHPAHRRCHVAGVSPCTTRRQDRHYCRFARRRRRQHEPHQGRGTGLGAP